MKFLLVCLIIGFAIFEVESRALQSNNFNPEESCVKELNLDRNEMLAVVDQRNTPEDNEDYGKFFVCLWKKREAMTEDGAVDKEGFRRAIGQIFSDMTNANNAEAVSKVLDKITDHCKDVHGKAPGQTAIKLKNCLMEYAAALAAGGV